MAAETKCAACDGTGEVICHINTADPVQRNFSWIKCSTCGGSGRVSSDMAARLAAGDRLRTLRVDELDLSLREGAARINVTPEQLSGFENGRYGLEEIACAERWMRAGGDPDVMSYPMIDLGIVSVTPPRGDGWSVRFRCGCHVYLYGRGWLIWSLGRNALGRRCDEHSGRIRVMEDTEVGRG